MQTGKDTYEKDNKRYWFFFVVAGKHKESAAYDYGEMWMSEQEEYL